MKSIYILIASLGIFLSGYSKKQSLRTPGFLGMRASLKYDFGIMANWDFSGTMPYMHHNVELGYALTRKHELVLKYSRMDYKGNSTKFDYYSYPTSDYYSGTHLQGIENSSAQIYSSNEAAVICKFYRNKRGYIAPVGRYFFLGIGYIQSVHKLQLLSNDVSFLPIKYTKKVTSHDVVIKIGLGRNFIVAKRIIISIEGLLNVPVSGLIRLSPVIQDQTPDYYKDKSLASLANKDIILKHLVEFKIGIGSLLF
jgi:hypothetical protein